MARDCRRKTEYMQHNQTSGRSGTDDKGKGKPGKGKGKQDKDKDRGKLGKDKSKNKKKGRCKYHCKYGKKRFREMEGPKKNKKDKFDTKTQSGLDWRSSDWSTDLWNDLAWERAARLLPSTQAGSRTVQSNAWKKQFNGRTDRQRRTLRADTPPRSTKHINSAKSAQQHHNLTS